MGRHWHFAEWRGIKRFGAIIKQRWRGGRNGKSRVQFATRVLAQFGVCGGGAGDAAFARSHSTARTQARRRAAWFGGLRKRRARPGAAGDEKLLSGWRRHRNAAEGRALGR